MNMSKVRTSDDREVLLSLDSAETRVLTSKQEKELLRELAACKTKLAQALAKIPGYLSPDQQDNPQAVSLSIASFYASSTKHTAVHARLGVVHADYNRLRTQLAMANMRLVAHVAKRFRDRGVSYSDLLQEGFCGLLEAIDRFDLSHETKLATYATWWIRQSVQRAVASCAYPVRLSPRHLRQLAQNQDGLESDNPESAAKRPIPDSDCVSTEVIQRIHAATRPTISLDATIDSDSNFSLLQLMCDPEGDRSEDVDLDETISKLLTCLRPREQEVLEFRFGLAGKPKMSLSQVGKVMLVSKERIRQIQDRAMEKLRLAAQEVGLLEGELVEV